MVNKYELTQIIEQVAPPESAEPWDLSGWIIETERTDVNKVMLCLTVTGDILQQAEEYGCDMIISHHPLFIVPLDFNRGIDIYCAHTNLDKAPCGTTETLIKQLGFTVNRATEHDFLRFCELNMPFDELLEKLKQVSTNIRIAKPAKTVGRAAFCGGSGADFWHDAYLNGADVLITGDLKFHTALDSKISIIDIGHFESEVGVLAELSRLLSPKVEIIKAKEKSPIEQINS
ncbi:MAG: Nif3-like dinuclear metal center hexameric protein [Fusobacterium sp.]|nr:Nif3-like dinuclear metal center hexameric protein [Fusobacterium sp.]